ncbi:hypothetical protein [Desulfonatronovibrio hydrogenovorans]|uniref:hypothetical protein n=1 Tax=Desulfonatronovibrio hydrogenovorans TaxID=53245 RepID=UPI00048D533E|nr:hypothetical protein [Desulfonatronovibrio hydrogenovorans]
MSLRANQADQALIQYEAGQEFVAMEALSTNDNKTFSSSDAPWSGVAGYEPVVRPDGLITGGTVTPGSGNNEIDISNLTAYLGGEQVDLTSIATQTVTRSTNSTDKFRINSVTITDAGEIAIVSGVDEGPAFSGTRGTAGGPPWIPEGHIEIAQIRLEGSDPEIVPADAVRQVVGVSTERYDFPLYAEDYGEGKIEFISALPEIHSDDNGVTRTCKSVFAEYYTPSFANLEPASEFIPPETTHSQTSTGVYGGAIGASSSALNQGSFTAYLRDGVTDPLLALKNQKLWFRFYPHRLRAPHLLAQGILGISRTFPAGDSIQAACTLTADGPAIEVAE